MTVVSSIIAGKGYAKSGFFRARNMSSSCTKSINKEQSRSVLLSPSMPEVLKEKGLNRGNEHEDDELHGSANEEKVAFHH